MRGELDAVLFDAGGVLVLPDPTVLGPLLAPYGGDPTVERHVRAHYAGMAVKSEQGADEHDWLAYDEAYVRSVGVVGPDVAEAAVVLGATRTAWLWRYPIAASSDALAELHRRGVPIGVVSNASGQIEGVLRRTAVCQVGVGRRDPGRVRGRLPRRRGGQARSGHLHLRPGRAGRAGRIGWPTSVTRS